MFIYPNLWIDIYLIFSTTIDNNYNQTGEKEINGEALLYEVTAEDMIQITNDDPSERVYQSQVKVYISRISLSAIHQSIHPSILI